MFRHYLNAADWHTQVVLGMMILEYLMVRVWLRKETER